MTKEEKIAAINAQYEQTVAQINERRDYRAKNYYDGVDDYSFGGICDQADNNAQNAALKERNVRLEEAENDGFHMEKSDMYVLANADGEIVTGAPFCTKFGDCWYDKVKECYVSVPKRLSTLTKKGYTLLHIEKSYKCKINQVNFNQHIINSTMELVDEKTTVCDNIPECMVWETPFCEWQYENFFLKAE